MAVSINTLKPGSLVTYVPSHGLKEPGIVKEVRLKDNKVFVVYRCNNEWENFRAYTGVNTSVEDLERGWPVEKLHLIKNNFNKQ